jgi:hypothetical protein
MHEPGHFGLTQVNELINSTMKAKSNYVNNITYYPNKPFNHLQQGYRSAEHTVDSMKQMRVTRSVPSRWLYTVNQVNRCLQFQFLSLSRWSLDL